MSAADTQILDLVGAAIRDTFKVQMSIDVSVKPVAVQSTKGAAPTLPVDILSVMGIKSSTHTGSMALAFPKQTFLNAVGKLLGETFTEISANNADACSEMLNIIYASGRAKINQLGFDFEPAIPSTIGGKDIWLPNAQFKNYIRFECDSEQGSFILAFFLKRN